MYYHCCNLSGGVALIVWLSPRTGCARRIKYMYVARTSNNRVISSGDLYCCLLPRCEALRICRSGFPIATSWRKLTKISFKSSHNQTAWRWSGLFLVRFSKTSIGTIALGRFRLPANNVIVLSPMCNTIFLNLTPVRRLFCQESWELPDEKVLFWLEKERVDGFEKH